MSVLVRIPTPLQKFTKNQSEVHIEGATVSEIIVQLDEHFPGVRERLCDDQGAVRKFINLYLNDEDIRFLETLDTPLTAGDDGVPPPPGMIPPGSENKVMHGALKIRGTMVMCSDGGCTNQTEFKFETLSFRRNSAARCVLSRRKATAFASCSCGCWNTSMANWAWNAWPVGSP